MIAFIESPMIGPSADRFTRFPRRLRAGKTRRISMAAFAILVLTMLCAFGPALRAQTAVYDGVTETTYPASGTSSFTNPTGVAMDSSGDLFVADSGNGYLTSDTKYTSIWELTSTGLRTFNAPTQIVVGTAAATGKYAYIMGVAVDPSGNVWFTDIGCKSTTIITCTTSGLLTIGGAVWELPKTSTGYGTAVSITLSSGSWGTPWGITVRQERKRLCRRQCESKDLRNSVRLYHGNCVDWRRAISQAPYCGCQQQSLCCQRHLADQHERHSL